MGFFCFLFVVVIWFVVLSHAGRNPLSDARGSATGQ